jgi:hypothetical protein
MNEIGQLLIKKVLDGALDPKNMKLSRKSKDTLIGAGSLIILSFVAAYQINKK